MSKTRLTNEDVKEKGYPKELIYDGIRTNVWYAPKRKKPTNEHWTAYINDKNIPKHRWEEIGKERNFQKAEPLVKQKAVDYYLKHYNIKTKKYSAKKKPKKLTPFIISDILTYYQDKYDIKKQQQADDKEKLQSAVNRNITTKGSNLYKCEEFFGTKDLRNIEEKHFYQFMDKRGVGKSTIGNNLSTFSTALKYKLDRLAGDLTISKRTKKALKEELKRVITIIRYFRSENKLTVKDALKRAKAPKLNGHGRISYEQFKNIIKWMRKNPEIEDGYTDFFIFLYWHSSRFSEASLLIGKNIIVENDDVKLHIPSIITKDMAGGTYSVFPDIEVILKKRLKENIQPEEPIFNITNTKNGKKQKITRGYYDKMWRLIKVKFDLRLPGGKYQTPHILRASCVNNLKEAEPINIHNQTRQSDEIIKHYLEAETINGVEVAHLKAWQDEQEQKLKEKADKKIGKKGIEVFFHSDKQKAKNDPSIFEL